MAMNSNRKIIDITHGGGEKRDETGIESYLVHRDVFTALC
jgi:hypothetical protein